MWERTGCMILTCAMETRDGGGNSLCPCVSLLHPLFFLASINTFRHLLRRRHKSKTSLTLLDSLTWAMLWYVSLNFSKTTLSSDGKESVLSLNSFIKHGLLCWCCFVSVFVSAFSKIAAAYLRSLSKACIFHKIITECKAVPKMFLSDWKLLGR